MIAKFNKQNIKHNLQKLIRRLAEQKTLSEAAPPQADEICRIREHNQIYHEKMIQRAYFYTHK